MKKKKINYSTIKNFNFSILLILVFFSSPIIFAQEVPTVNVTLKLKIKDGDLKNSQITITKKGAPYKVIDPTSNGTAVDLPLGFEYVFTFSKIGYVTNSVVVNTHVPENREKGKFAKQISEVELEKQSGKLEDNYVHVIGQIMYNMSKGDFDFDKGSIAKTDKIKKNEQGSSPIPKAKTNTTVSHKSNQVQPVLEQSGNNSNVISTGPIIKNKVKKIIQEDSRKITIITVTSDGKEYVYKKEEYGWGIYFYKDGKSITESTFKNETE